MDEKITLTKSELKQLIKDELAEMTGKKQNKHTKGRYAEARKKYITLIKKQAEPYHAHKIADAIKEICRNHLEISYINKATDEQIEKMGVLYEYMAESYLKWAKEDKKRG